MSDDKVFVVEGYTETLNILKLLREHSAVVPCYESQEEAFTKAEKYLKIYGGARAGGSYELLYVEESLNEHIRTQECEDTNTLIVPKKQKQVGKHEQPFYHKGKW